MIYDIPLDDIFEAYYDCRRHKRTKSGALQFELDLESNLIELWHDLRSGTYRIRPSTVFIVDKPVKREIFAADFRDRIVHHLLMQYLMPVLEKHFIYDSYSCRAGKGTHFAVRRVEHFIRSLSHNGMRPAWVMHLDIASFFMSICKPLLLDKLMMIIDAHYKAKNVEFVKYLVRTIVHNDPRADCIYHSTPDKWNDLQFGKSLFDTDDDCGLPIGNYTSQVFANLYLSELDHYIKHTLCIEYYGRYVDDMIFVSSSRSQLCRIVRLIDDYLQSHLKLHLNPRKIYLQPVTNGVRFLGTFIRTHHTIVSRRFVRNFRRCIARHNMIADDHKPTVPERTSLISSINSYLGLMQHYKTFRIRSHILSECLSPKWRLHITPNEACTKVKKR